uniref:NB-ARC domain-containing protein n=1 Tax=Fagus sylvatica TaxID=28930 RepID=A0A2N9FIU8_FAGSY
MGSLRDKWQYLEARKTEIESRIGGKQPTKQVELWLRKVDKIKGEVQAIEGKFANMNYFSRAHVGELASKMITKVEDHYKMELPGSLVLDPPGETFPTTVLIGESTVERVKEKIWACLLDDDDVRKIGVYGMGDLKAIAEEVLERCAQLPLAIVTIAASFKCLIHDFEWRDALEDLKTSCLLHCALYPEDFEIEKQELIEHLIDEGIIERRNSRQAEFDRGYSMLNKLENACLLEGGIEENDEEKFVKMHDLVRDMVLRVASPQFKVEGHLGLEDFSDEGKWREDLVKASLMYNNISRIPPNASPMCPKLSTLLLQGLEGCWWLKHVPSLAKLTKLRKLDLGNTGITEVPHGLEMLVNLRYLNLNVNTLKIMPPEILPKLSCLQYLIFFSDMKLEEVASLKNLETFGGRFSDMYEFSTYMEKGQLATYEIHVGSIRDLAGSIRGKKVVLASCNISRGEESFVLPKDVHDLEIAQLKEKDASAQVPPHTFSRLKIISIYFCSKLKKLLPPGLLLHLHNLEEIYVYSCKQLEEIIEEEEEKEEEGMDTTKITLPRLKILNLQSLSELKSICSSSKVISCDSIEEILITRCPKLKRLPLSLPLLNGPLSPPPSLKKIDSRGRMVGIVGVGLSRH